MPTLTVTPNPVAPSKRLDIVGAGFSPSSGVSVTMDGITFVAKVYPANDGSFRFSLPTPTVAGPRTIRATTAGKVMASAPVVVGVPPPPPPVGPKISGIASAEITQTGAAISWTLNEPSTGQVEYGPTTAYGKLSTLEPTFQYLTHVQRLTGLLAGTVYHFRVRSKNRAGGESVSADQTFTTIASVPGAPPPPPATGTRPDNHPAPNILRQVQLPPSIDAAAGADVTAACRSFIAAIPNGTEILGAGPAASYWISASVLLGVMKGKDSIIFNGQGALLDNRAGIASSTASNERSAFYWSWLDKPFPTNLVFRNWRVKGTRPTQANGHVKLVGSEFAAFAHIQGGQYMEIDNITGGGLWGDLVTLNSDVQRVWIHHCAPTDVGRNNVSLVYASHVVTEDNKFGKAGYCAYDIEPEPLYSGPMTDLIYRRNESGEWDNCYIAVDGANSGHPLGGIVIDDNKSIGASLHSIVGYSLASPPYKTRYKQVSFQRNKGPAAELLFSHIDGLTVRGNDGTVRMVDCPTPVTA